MVRAGLERREKKRLEPLSLDTTVNLHRRCYKVQFKKRAPRALREIRAFVQKTMKTEDVRIDPLVNQFIWAKGIHSLPRRIRLRLARERSTQSDGQEALHTSVRLIETTEFANLQTHKSA